MRPSTKAKQRRFLAQLILEAGEEIRARIAFRARMVDLYEELHNRPARGRGRTVSNKVTPELRARVRNIAAADPTLPHSSIAEIVGVNSGRISEILSGKRT